LQEEGKNQNTENARLWNSFNKACGITELLCLNIDLHLRYIKVLIVLFRMDMCVYEFGYIINILGFRIIYAVNKAALYLHEE
jgi:hypothetical protein